MPRERVDHGEAQLRIRRSKSLGDHVSKCSSGCSGIEIGYGAIPPQGGWWLSKRTQQVTPSTFGPGMPA